MLMTSAEFDHMRLRHALRKQEQSSEEDGQRLDERKTTHGALLNHITDLDQQVKAAPDRQRVRPRSLSLIPAR